MDKLLKFICCIWSLSAFRDLTVYLSFYYSSKTNIYFAVVKTANCTTK